MKPRDLLDFKDHFIHATAVLRGEFDVEIADLKAKIAEWDTRNNLSDVQAKVDASYAEITAAKQSVEQQASDHTTRLNALQDSIAKRESDVSMREAKVSAMQIELQNQLDKVANESADFKKNAAIQNADLADKLKQAEDVLNDLTNRQTAISQREANVKAAAALVQ